MRMQMQIGFPRNTQTQGTHRITDNMTIQPVRVYLLHSIVGNGWTADQVDVLQLAAIVSNLDEYLVGNTGRIRERQYGELVQLPEKDNQAALSNGATVRNVELHQLALVQRQSVHSSSGQPLALGQLQHAQTLALHDDRLQRKGRDIDALVQVDGPQAFLWVTMPCFPLSLPTRTSMRSPRKKLQSSIRINKIG